MLETCGFTDIDARPCDMPIVVRILLEGHPYPFCAEHERWVIAEFEDWNPIDG